MKLTKHRLKNILHTIVLLCAMAGISAIIGYGIAGMMGLVVAGVFGIVTLLVSARLPNHLRMRLLGAQPLSNAFAPGLSRTVEELARRADLPTTPKLYYMPTPLLNAAATGTRANSAIALTDGTLRHLTPRELAGVIAHEIGHLRSGDAFVMGLAEVLSRVTRMFSDIGKLLLLINLPFLLFDGVPFPWLLVVVLLVAPTIVGLLQMALSRTREFDADLESVKLTGDPIAFATALAKLERHNEGLIRHLIWPGYRQPNSSILRTHPHTRERIERLRELAGKEDDSPAPKIISRNTPPEGHRSIPRIFVYR
jgi:heat shock protein HtpX